MVTIALVIVALVIVALVVVANMGKKNDYKYGPTSHEGLGHRISQTEE